MLVGFSLVLGREGRLQWVEQSSVGEEVVSRVLQRRGKHLIAVKSVLIQLLLIQLLLNDKRLNA